MNIIKRYFKNRKTLKYKSLIFWGYIFLTYLIFRPHDRDLSTHIVKNENFTDLYVKFPIIIYWIIIFAILIEFIKLLKKNLFVNSFHIFIITPLLLFGLSFLIYLGY